MALFALPKLPPRRPPIAKFFLAVFLLSITFLFTEQIISVSRRRGFLSSVSVPVAIAIVSDSHFSSKFRTQARSIECYATLHGYEFFLLDPAEVAPICHTNHKEFFFRKHCTIAQWLLTRPAHSFVVVVDGDVVAGTANRSLDAWLRYDFDLAFYERSWNFEVMSGNYVVRNTKFSRLFLQHWASYEYIVPRGFSSADNGAIHLALLHALAIQGRQRCRDLYCRLEADVTDLEPYYHFVACTKRLLGPARTYHAYEPTHVRKKENDSKNPAGTIVIFPRLFGFAVDARVHGYTKLRNLHPLHHGIKSDDWKSEYIDHGDRGSNSTGCRLFTSNGTISAENMGQVLEQSDDTMMQSTGEPYSSVPRWGHTDQTCYDRLWCGPLPSSATEWPLGFVSQNGTILSYEYSDPGVDWHNEFVAALYT